jgi:hypothetical protein
VGAPSVVEAHPSEELGSTPGTFFLAPASGPDQEQHEIGADPCRHVSHVLTTMPSECSSSSVSSCTIKKSNQSPFKSTLAPKICTHLHCSRCTIQSCCSSSPSPPPLPRCLLHGDKMGNGEEEKQPLLLHPAVVARPHALLHRCLPRRRKGRVKQRGKAERMTTGATGENNSVSREGQFRLFSCSVGHKGLH